MQQKLIRKREAAILTGRSISGLERLQRTDPTFPRPVKFGTTRQASVFFDGAEIDAWIEAKKAQRSEVAA